MKLSKYTIMFTENENGKTILFNTLTGAVFKLNEEYKKIIEEKNLENLTDDETL
ncbi:TPA: radical SAM/SPASM domain-containing protein, partial [Enterococcus faecium]|nr:radical SAM/SPASM domain-containing protein [Enterococcus faecium]